MYKILVLLFILGISPIIAGIYGMIHDQITYSISAEYYTRFKFIQFGYASPETAPTLPNPRYYAALVGFRATWWVGIYIGIVLGLVGLRHATASAMFNTSIYAMLLTIAIALLTGLVGLVYGKFFITGRPQGWFLPDNLLNEANFIAVGAMHNFSYLGGLIGLIAAVIYSLLK